MEEALVRARGRDSFQAKGRGRSTRLIQAKAAKLERQKQREAQAQQSAVNGVDSDDSDDSDDFTTDY
ncbi:hypothetical protein CYMTET_45007 [Cymbomonas tetramitiformis]|uniref:Uncharacterized protein n=1 Tax=Cymbomonas tetramitiformis TaxID=36881 RepID=A0AAE0C0A9_9CHLO|nr:hypothetical protein CYMTET_45007 [Cymbomonas tetramitiformis]